MTVGAVTFGTDAVSAYLRLEGGRDADLVGDVVAAVTAWCARAVPGLAALTDPSDVTAWPDDVAQGAVMLAARLYRRRNTPSGVEALGDAGAVYVPRRDSDVDMLLGLGVFGPVVV